MTVLWEKGRGSVADVVAALRRKKAVNYSTVQTMLRILEDKGYVAHEKEGRAFIYRPVMKRDETTQHMASQLLSRVFDGAVDQLVQSLLTAQQPTADELDRLESMIANLKSNRRENNTRGNPPAGKSKP